MEPVTLSKFGWWWLGGTAMGFAIYWGLSELDTTTILFPGNDRVLELILWAGGLTGIVSIFVGLSQSEGSLSARLLLAVLGFGMGGALTATLLLVTLSDLIQNWFYFPAHETQTYRATIPIERAYVGQARYCRAQNSCWNVQTTPLWSVLNVFEDDYEFMLANRSPDDAGKDPEEISSNGRHCLQVTMQQAGEALRILEAGAGTLPNGSVVACPRQPQNEILILRRATS